MQQYTYAPNTQQHTQQYNDTLQPVCNFGFSFNNLITVGLVHRIPPPDLAHRDYKDKYIFFVTSAPGITNQGNRTYDFQNSIKMKFSLREIESLSFILKQCSIGNENNVLPYSKFSGGQDNSKTLTIWTGQSNRSITVNNQQVYPKQIFISFNANQRVTTSVGIAEAHGIGEILYKMFDYGMQLEIEYQRNNPLAFDNNQQNQTGGYAQTGAQLQAPMGMQQNAFQFPPQSQPQPQQNQFNSAGGPPQQTNQMMPPPQQAPFNPAQFDPHQNQNPFPSDQFPNAQQQTSETTQQFGQMLQNVGG